MPFPPLGLRVALRAAQAVVYANQQPLNKAELALAARTFAIGSHPTTRRGSLWRRSFSCLWPAVSNREQTY